MLKVPFPLFLITILVLCLVAPNRSVAGGGDPEIIYYSTDAFEVTDFDLRMYLRGAPDAEENGIGSRARNLQALSDLYAMQVLISDARQEALLTEAELEWVANYAAGLEMIKRYLSAEVAKRMAETDWDAVALEHYLANPKEFEVPESVTVRTLLVRTASRSEEEALGLANELLQEVARPDADFDALVRAHTEDEVAAESGGLIEGVTRGKTVQPFEDAAFALREPGEFSEPVITEFGVHLIQLVERQDTRMRTFDESKAQIIADLKPRRAAQYRAGIQNEARERKPEGFVEHTEALDALMEQTSDGALGLK
jgi:peptidyl-prolyl cis-trans isomerase C